MSDLGLLIIRLTVGGLLAGHGAQKLFGWFGGHGLAGTGGWLESLGLRPGSRWATLAGLSEFSGGLLTALGLFHPVGPLVMLAPMSVAVGKVHWGRPIWVTEGGAELPVTNLAVALGLVLTGPGRLSLDRLLGVRPPAPLPALAAAGVVIGTVLALTPRPAPARPQAETAGAELQAGRGGGAPEPL
jgi:putative oxidoreductase